MIEQGMKVQKQKDCCYIKNGSCYEADKAVTEPVT
jgi:hypothetical protein